MSAPIVIAGAGIGGLTAALALARAGKRALVLERATTIEEVGAGLQIAPNAGRILAELGLEPALRRRRAGARGDQHSPRARRRGSGAAGFV